jgi:cytidylate kinase
MSRIIAVDGPTASGKGTLSRRLADHFGFAWLDTGGLYRATALRLIRDGSDGRDVAKAIAAAKGITDADRNDPGLRAEATGNMASRVAAMQPVRDALFDYQRDFAAHPPNGASGAVLDGRDIGTVICPYADVKLFVTASEEIRAGRRHTELTGKGQSISVADVLADLKVRDARDSGRKNAPLAAAEDAVLIDTSNMDIEAAFSAALEACVARWNGNHAG